MQISFIEMFQMLENVKRVQVLGVRDRKYKWFKPNLFDKF